MTSPTQPRSSAISSPCAVAGYTGRLVPSHITGISWHPRGGVVVESPASLAGMVLKTAREQAFPRIDSDGISVSGGCEAWVEFAALDRPRATLAIAMLLLDEMPSRVAVSHDATRSASKRAS